MMTSLRTMLACRWAARRVERYLDSDPSALLDAAQARRLQAHLAECARCTRRVEEYRALGRALGDWSARRAPEPARVARLREQAERLITQGRQ